MDLLNNAKRQGAAQNPCPALLFAVSAAAGHCPVRRAGFFIQKQQWVGHLEYYPTLQQFSREGNYAIEAS
ncbi:MAG: hypothetical protein J1E80_07815 [Desulfovibrionaceae bacterium]|nr:hypothetical protein [Desulfovibrionaceae bacterium]